MGVSTTLNTAMMILQLLKNICPFYIAHLTDREPEELWMEVHDIVQEAGIKTIPKEKKCKKAKWLSEEALRIAEKEEKLKARRKGELYTTECRIPKNSKER